MLSTKKANILRDKKNCTPARVKNSIFLALQQLQKGMSMCLCANECASKAHSHTCVHAKQNGVFKLYNTHTHTVMIIQNGDAESAA